MTDRERVLVIGGGVAGLGAARELLRRHVPVTLLEARPRLGGRVLTRRDDAVPWPVELGAELIEEAQGPVAAALRGIGDAPLAPPGTAWVRWAESGPGGGPQPLPGLVSTIGHALARACPPAGADRPLRAALRAALPGPLWTSTRALVAQYVEGYHAADLERVSARWVAGVEGVLDAPPPPLAAPGQPPLGEEGLGFLCAPGGLDRLTEHLARPVLLAGEVRLGEEVVEVAWRPGRVEVRTRRGLRCGGRAAIVTLPLPLLAGEAVTFDPPLREKRPALAGLAMGSVVKLVLRFDRLPAAPALEGTGTRFLFAPGQPFPTFWTPAPGDAPLLVAWAGGPAARRLRGLEPERRAAAAVDALAHALGHTPRAVRDRLRAVHAHDWDADRFARGAYSWVPAGAGAAPAALARPLAGTLHFAGEATCSGGDNATLEGALRSGLRAARELLSQAQRAA